MHKSFVKKGYMKKSIKNDAPVIPIVHKPRNTHHKTFGENIDHGNFTFNNEDYRKANGWAKVFGHSKFIRMLWRLMLPVMVYAIISSLAPLLFTTMISHAYHDVYGTTISKIILYTWGKFGSINIIVATSWGIMLFPIVGNYIGRNKPQQMQEAVRFIFYIMMITSTIGVIIEFILAPEIAHKFIFKTADYTYYQDLINNIPITGSHAVKNFTSAYQIYYSALSIKYFSFSSYFVGVAYIFIPMFSAMRKNSVLITSTVIGLIFFVIIYSAVLFGTQFDASKYLIETHKISNGKTKIVYIPTEVGYHNFAPVLNFSDGIFLGYQIIMPAVVIIYCFFPKMFKISTLFIKNSLKNIYNSMVDKQSNLEYKISKLENKKFDIEHKMQFNSMMVEGLQGLLKNRDENGNLSPELRELNAKTQEKINYYQSIINNSHDIWLKEIDDLNKQINSLKAELANTPSTNKTLFYIDYSEYTNLNNYERTFLWFNGSDVPLKIGKFRSWLIHTFHIHCWDNKNTQILSFRVSGETMKHVWKTSGGVFADQMFYGVLSLVISIYATNFYGNLLGLQGSTPQEAGEYYKAIYFGTRLISNNFLNYLFGGILLLPQYFVAYYLGRNDKETAYHNSMILINWAIVFGFLLCLIILIYGACYNEAHFTKSIFETDLHTIWSNDGKTKSVLDNITYTKFITDCFIMEAILAIVELFEVGTAMTFFILASGGCVWTWFSDQVVRILNLVALLLLYYGSQKINGQPAIPAIYHYTTTCSANMIIYYIISRTHAVLPLFISWIFIERGLALRSIEQNHEIITSDSSSSSKFIPISPSTLEKLSLEKLRTRVNNEY